MPDIRANPWLQDEDGIGTGNGGKERSSVVSAVTRGERRKIATARWGQSGRREVFASEVVVLLQYILRLRRRSKKRPRRVFREWVE